MLESIFYSGAFDLQDVCLSLGTALILGVAISLIFRMTDRSGSNITIILAVLPMLVASVIMIVNGNLGTSVAVLGAFGLVRFRSGTGTAREIAYIFFGMAVGLASGMGFLTMAFLITLIASAAMLILDRSGIDSYVPKERELRITIPEDLSYHGIFDDLFERYTNRWGLRRVRTTNMGTMYELSYRIIMKDQKEEKDFIDDLRCRNGNLTISMGLAQKERNEF